MFDDGWMTDETGPVIEDVISDEDDAILRAHLIEQERFQAEQERWYGEQQAHFEAAQTAQARAYEANQPYDPVATSAFQPPPEVIQPRRPHHQYQSPLRANEGHAAKKKSGLDMTPNSSRLNSSLKELSLEKERPVADDVGSQRTAATKKKLQAKPAKGVPPEQTVKGTLPQHQRLLDEAGPSDPGRF